MGKGGFVSALFFVLIMSPLCLIVKPESAWLFAELRVPRQAIGLAVHGE